MATEKFKVQTKTIEVYDTCLTAESKIVIDSLKSYFVNFYATDVFKNILYESDLFEIPTIDGVKFFALSFFDNITRILSTYSSLGSHNAIISLWKGILGDEAIIEFIYRDNDGVYTDEVNISTIATTQGDLLDAEGNQLITTTEEDVLQWINNRTGLETNELIALVNYYIPAGIYIKWNFVTPPQTLKTTKTKSKRRK